LLEPVAVCLEAVQRGRIGRGDNVLVVGDGPFGIIIARLASRCEPGRIILVGRHEFRLRQVPQAIALNEKQTPQVPEAVLKANLGLGLDVAIMAAGTQTALDLCLGSLRARGRAVVFSALAGRASVDLFRLHVHELEILGACNDLDLVDGALERMADPRLQLSSLITHRLPFAQWPRAFELARGKKDEALKVALAFDRAIA
jgi:threonine dehydrogenase-like Zn-dependent dehydrogenase